MPLALGPAVEQLIVSDPYVCSVCNDGVLSDLNESTAQAQTATWLRVCGSTKAAHTFRGTQPGRQLADLVFNM
eukprot:8561146-Karenia_brevis.AAC.1